MNLNQIDWCFDALCAGTLGLDRDGSNGLQILSNIPMISGFYAVLMLLEERESVCCWAGLQNSSVALLLWINSFWVA